MKPYYQDDHCTIYHGDCSEIMPALPKFDLLLTDPPYGHGEKWNGGTWASNPIYQEAFKWDAKRPEVNLLIDLIAKTDAAIIWGGNYFDLPGSRCYLSWEKTSRMDTLADFELAWTNLDKPSKAFAADRNPDGRRSHPTQKPIGLMLWCIGLASNPATILDPFMGSGSTLRAAKDLGLKATGIELSEHYCEIAAKRLAQECLDLT